MSTESLAERDRALLDFEREWSVHQGDKEHAVRERFGFSAARYYQLIARLVDDPLALAYDPLTVRRLRRRRDERRNRRVAKSFGERAGR